MGRKFNKLERKIEKEYEEKGVSRERARRIGNATAAKIYRNKAKRKNLSRK